MSRVARVESRWERGARPRVGVAFATMLTGLAVLSLAAPSSVVGQRVPTRGDATERHAPALNYVKVNEALGEALPLDTELVDHRGRNVSLRDFFDGEKPVLLNFAYHTCPVVCDAVLNATVETMGQIDWTAGEDYQFVSISIDPRDSPESATDTRATLLERYGRDGSDGFHFLTGEDEDVRAIADAVGFEYVWVSGQEEFAHPAAIMLVTPDGKMARYLYGIAYSSSDLRFGLYEASQGRSLNTVEQVLIYCYRYDESAGKYQVMAMRVMQVGGVITATLLLGLLGMFWVREFRRRRNRELAAANGVFEDDPSGSDTTGATSAQEVQAT
ncbi:MAG: SCO family protein [Myxococcota bacterium]